MHENAVMKYIALHADLKINKKFKCIWQPFDC